VLARLFEENSVEMDAEILIEQHQQVRAVSNQCLLELVERIGHGHDIDTERIALIADDGTKHAVHVAEIFLDRCLRHRGGAQIGL